LNEDEIKQLTTREIFAYFKIIDKVRSRADVPSNGGTGLLIVLAVLDRRPAAAKNVTPSPYDTRPPASAKYR